MRPTIFVTIIRLFLVSLLPIVATSCASNPVSVENDVAYLNDSPSAKFDIADWSYSNTSSPFLLTPDSFANAFIGVSRLSKGDSTPNSDVSVPTTLDIDSIRSMMESRLAEVPQKKISIKNIDGKNVVISERSEKGRSIVEYAFAFEEGLAHVLLNAVPGRYYDMGMEVAEGIVASFEPT